VSIALGVGANAAVLSAIDTALIDGLPQTEAARLVLIDSVAADTPDLTRNVSINEFLSWKRDSAAFDAMDAILSGPITLGGDGSGRYTERVSSHRVTGGLFATLEATALVGRTFTFEESRLIDPAPAVLISERLWRDRFGAEPAVVGSTVRVNREARTLVGVLPRTFRFQSEGVDVWVPLRLVPQADEGGLRPLRVIARLRQGVSLQEAEADLDRMTAGVARGTPEPPGGWRPRVRPLDEALLGWSREPLLMLQTAVALVWLIACANVAGLLLARGSVRQREIGMRVALGAGRRRVIRQLLTETMLVALAGSVLALVVARVGLIGLSALSPPLDSPAIGAVRLDATVFGVILALSVLSALLVGLVPAFASARADPLATLRSSDAEASTAPSQRGRSLLVVGQFGLALTLLIGAGLLVHSALRLTGRDLNFDPDGVFTFSVNLPADLRLAGAVDGHPYFDVASTPALTFARMLDGLGGLPGVESAGASSYPVINSLIVPRYDVVLEDDPAPGPAGRPAGQAVYSIVTPGLFETLRTPVLRGRAVSGADVAGTPWVAVVNETAARRFWPDDEALGQRLRLDTVPDDRAREVVGVVADIPRGHDETEPEPIVYASYLQQPRRWRAPWRALFHEMTFVVRTTGDPMAIVPAARGVVAAIDPDVPLGVSTVGTRLAAATRRVRYVALLVAALGGVAAGLAAIGIHGTMSYAVNRRRRELGIRKALGASPFRLAALVAGQALAIVAAGVVLGIAAAVPLARFLEPQLWSIGPRDPSTYAAASLCLVTVAGLACLLPTRRAVAVDSAATLRSE
jgi:putative ABC transport system permease protein